MIRKLLVIAAQVALVWSASFSCGFAAPRDDYEVSDRDRQYDILPTDKPAEASQKKNALRIRRNQIRDMLKQDGPLTPEKQNEFDKWYLNYEFPTMTLFTPEALKELPDARRRLLKEDIERAENKAFHDHLVALAFDYFSKLVDGDYHPAVRYNAVLIVGELNDKEMSRSGAAPAPPLPLAAALRFLTGELEKENTSDSIRLGSMVGLLRHVQLDAQDEVRPQPNRIPAAEIQRLRTVTLNLVNTPKPPANRSQAGHDWMRRRALELLAWIAAGRVDQEIVDTIVARLADSDENRGVRCDAARALSIVAYTPDARHPGGAPIKIKVREAAADLVQFIVDSVNADIKDVDGYFDSLIDADKVYRGGGGSYSGGGGADGMGPKHRKPKTKDGYGPGAGYAPSSGTPSMYGSGYGKAKKPADPYAYRVEPVYRKLRYEIGCAMMGLRGTEEWRRGDGIGGLYKAVGNDPKAADDKAYLEEAGRRLKTLSDSFKVKDEEIETEKFAVEKLKLADLAKFAAEGAAGKKPVRPAPAVEEEPAAEPDPAEEIEMAAEAPPAKPKPADKAAAPKPAADAPELPE
jgi:hypothetical protein